MNTLSIIIVNYNVAEYLRRCLSSIISFSYNIDLEIIVIDNNSSDDGWTKLIAEFPKVRFIQLEENLGFSKANNIGVHYATSKYILLLNPDTELFENSLEQVLEFANSKNNLGCIGVRLYDKQGNFHAESKRSIPNIFNSFQKLFLSKKQKNRGYYRNDIDEYSIAKVEVITGAFLFCEKEKYLEVGGLDEAYFMYGEDIDLCYTFIQHGYENWYYGKTSVLHHKGESTIKNEIYIERFYGAMKIFLKKYFYSQKKIFYWMAIFGIEFKMLMEKIKLKNKSKYV